MSSVLLTRELAREAVELVLPSIELLLKNRGKRQAFHLVILDPTVRPWNGTFDEAILYEHSLYRESWDKDYGAVARSKALQTWRDGQGLPNILHHELAPASLQRGDAEAWSSFNWYGLTVAGSGVQRWFDFLIGGWVALACQMLARDEAEAVRNDPERSEY